VYDKKELKASIRACYYLNGNKTLCLVHFIAIFTNKKASPLPGKAFFVI